VLSQMRNNRTVYSRAEKMQPRVSPLRSSASATIFGRDDTLFKGSRLRVAGTKTARCAAFLITDR
jgi:hypothetical protein